MGPSILKTNIKMSKTQQKIKVDITIIGGGIAGLWLLNYLRAQGYNAILFEQEALGSGQTIASQGIIHGGMKYTLGGTLTGSSEAIAEMPNHWRSCLAGQGDVNLSRAKILSDQIYFWSHAGFGSKLMTFFASQAIRGRITAVTKPDYPPVFQNDSFNGKLYRLQDIVVDIPEVLQALTENYQKAIFKIDWQQAQLTQADDGQVKALQIHHQEKTLVIQSQRFIFTAGEGNETLLQQLSLTQPAMQRRPLHQVWFKHDYPHALYAHCIGNSALPRLTLSSHATFGGKWIWYLGGELATKGIEQSESELITKAKQELKKLFSWIDFGETQWGCLRINRAEPKQRASMLLPDKAYVAASDKVKNVIIAWPTKLTLSPNLAHEVGALLQKQQINPKYPGLNELTNLPPPPIAKPFWE